MKIIEYVKERLIFLPPEIKEKVFTIAIFVFALIVAGVLYKSQTSNLKLLNSRKGTEIKKNEALKEIQQLEKAIKSYTGLLPEKDASAIVNTISSIAKESGVQVVSLEPGRQEKQPLYIKYPFMINIRAESYHAIGKFISKLESRSGVYSVEALSIRPSSVDTPEDKLTVSLTLNIIAFTG